MRVAVIAFALVSLVVAVGGCGTTSEPEPVMTAGVTTFTSLDGIGIPASADDATFNGGMSKTPVFSVEGKLVVRVMIFKKESVDACVEGYVMPEDAPSDPTTYLQYGELFTLSDYIADGIDSSTASFDLNGRYYVVAAGQDCTWSLDVMK